MKKNRLSRFNFKHFNANLMLETIFNAFFKAKNLVKKQMYTVNIQESFGVVASTDLRIHNACTATRFEEP